MHQINGRWGRTLVVAAMLGAAVFAGGSVPAFARTSAQHADCVKVPPLAISLSPMSGPAGSLVMVSANWPMTCPAKGVIKFRDSLGKVTWMEKFHIPVGKGGFAKIVTIPVNAAPGMAKVNVVLHYLVCDQDGCRKTIAKDSAPFHVT